MIKLNIRNTDDANDGECVVSLHIEIAAWYACPEKLFARFKKAFMVSVLVNVGDVLLII